MIKSLNSEVTIAGSPALNTLAKRSLFHPISFHPIALFYLSLITHHHLELLIYFPVYVFIHHPPLDLYLLKN